MTNKRPWILASFLITFISFGVCASEKASKLYDQYSEQIKFGKTDFQSYSLINKDVYVDALWNAAIEDSEISITRSLSGLSIQSDRNTAKLFILAHFKRDTANTQKYYKMLMERIYGMKISNAGLYVLWAYKLDKSYPSMYTKAKDNYFEEFHYFMIVNKFMPKSIEEISSLINETPTLTSNTMKSYSNSPRLFLFCRHSRDYACRFVVKNNDGDYLKNGLDIWSLPALAHGRGDTKFHTTNGYTPQGVHTIDSVMPEANRQRAFGKNRRVILNFLPGTQGNEYEIEAIPGDAKFSTWWHEANISRTVKRQYLRIHGTGRLNTDPKTPYYPHLTSSGCITVREGSYGKNKFNDQKVILDALLRASDLDSNFSNELKIKGLLYVVEIDDEKRAVTRADLTKYGI
jgi:hypothetical protein